MRHTLCRLLAPAFFCLAAALPALTQTTVTTNGGTVNSVPKFTGSTTIGDSAITESGGNVGIGTTAPGQKLDVHGDTAFGITTNAFSNEWYSGSVYSSSGRRFALEFLNAESGSNVGSDFLLNAYSDNGLYLSTPFAIQRSTGNVGIGTYTPGQKLDVHGDTAFAIFPNGFSNEWYNGDVYAPEKRRLGFVFSGTESGGNAGSDLLINTYSDSGNYLANPFTIKRSTGYVGIGTTSPQYKLDVNGTMHTTGIFFNDGTFLGTGAVGSITGVYPTSGGGLTGGGASGNVYLGVDNTVPRTNYTNYFSGLQVYNGGIQSRIGATFQNMNLGNIVDFYSDSLGRWVTSLYQNGNFVTSGGIYGSVKQFRIDHPLDPANKILYHTSVESPDMKTIYDGVVQLGADGSAWIDLPDYFQALNRDFRYQLTAIGAPAPGLYIASEISENRFQIAGGNPGSKISWQVTGIRQDAYAKAYPAPVEDKKAEPGTYIHPDFFGQTVVPTPR